MKSLILLLFFVFSTSVWALEFDQLEITGFGSPSVVKAADLNADGLEDLVVDDTNSDSFVVYLQTKDKQFEEGQRLNLPQGEEVFYLDFELGLFDGDDLLDLMIFNSSQNHFFFKGQQLGRFGEAQVFPVGTADDYLSKKFRQLGSKVDSLFVLETNINLGYLEFNVLLHQHKGAFSSYKTLKKTVNLAPYLIKKKLMDIELEIDDFALGDYNGDGHLDLALVCGTRDFLLLFTGDGDFNFKLDNDFDTYRGAGRLYMSDVNGDGKDEIFVGHFSYHQSLVFSEFDGKMQRQQALVTRKYPTGFAFDKKSKHFVSVDYYKGQISFFKNYKKTYFSANPDLTLNLGDNAYSLEMSDLNRDGLTDYIVSDHKLNKLFVLFAK